jgi:hypothetical protein
MNALQSLPEVFTGIHCASRIATGRRELDQRERNLDDD